MPGAVGGDHSHRPTTKTSHKAFKSRKATKGQLRDAAKGMSHAGYLPNLIQGLPLGEGDHNKKEALSRLKEGLS
jgi:hypothetical protein